MNRFFLIFSFAIASIIQTQTVIGNPVKSLNDRAGRLVKVQEILRITDEGGNFYFQYPRFIKVAADGTIFVYDQDERLIVHSTNPNKIVWFDFDGILIKDLKIFAIEYKWAVITFEGKRYGNERPFHF